MQQCKLNYAAQFLVSECVYHVFCENVQLGAVQPLGALLTAVQRFSPRHEDGTAHIPHAHGLLCKEGPWLTGLEDEHCVGHGRKRSNQEPLRNTANMKKKKMLFWSQVNGSYQFKEEDRTDLGQICLFLFTHSHNALHWTLFQYWTISCSNINERRYSLHVGCCCCSGNFYVTFSYVPPNSLPVSYPAIGNIREGVPSLLPLFSVKHKPQCLSISYILLQYF